MRHHEINSLDNFIMGFYMDQDELCDDIIQHHQLNPYKQPGATAKGIDTSFKDSTDCLMDDDALWIRYSKALQTCVDSYIDKYPECNSGSPWRPLNYPLVQHYAPSQAFHGWHTERIFAAPHILSRHLVFMTYLNTVTDGGETEFKFQKLKIKPEKGLTLIWGVDWTFTHRGLTSMTQDKYIVTGWFNLVS